MIFSSLAEQYYDWLYKSVCGEWEPRNLSFHRLLMFLYNRNYVPACEMDISRAVDGTNLRYRFATENDISYARIDSAFYGYPVQHARDDGWAFHPYRGTYYGGLFGRKENRAVVLEHGR